MIWLWMINDCLKRVSSALVIISLKEMIGDWNYRVVCWFDGKWLLHCMFEDWNDCGNEFSVRVNVFQNPILSMIEFEDYSVY